LLGDTVIALVQYVVTANIKTRIRGEMLTSRSQLLNALGRGYAYGYWWESQKERDHYEDQEVGG
jgi:hypothetical protein